MLAPTICQSAREAPQCPQDSLRRSASCRPCGRSPGPRPSAPANAVTLPAGSPAKSVPARSPPAAVAPGFLRWRSVSDHPALPSPPVRKSARTVSYCLPMLDVKREKMQAEFSFRNFKTWPALPVARYAARHHPSRKVSSRKSSWFPANSLQLVGSAVAAASDPRWHRPFFSLRPAPPNTLPSAPSDRPSAHPVLPLPSRPAVQNKAHSFVLERFAYCPRWTNSLESVSS